MAHVRLSELDLILAVNDMGGNEILVGLLPSWLLSSLIVKVIPLQVVVVELRSQRYSKRIIVRTRAGHELTIMWSF